jgi:hypothetical protein
MNRSPDSNPRMCGSVRSPLYGIALFRQRKIHGDLSAARNVNTSERALNQGSLQLTRNHRIPGSTPATPTIGSRARRMPRSEDSFTLVVSRSKRTAANHPTNDSASKPSNSRDGIWGRHIRASTRLRLSLRIRGHFESTRVPLILCDCPGPRLDLGVLRTRLASNDASDRAGLSTASSRSADWLLFDTLRLHDV